MDNNKQYYEISDAFLALKDIDDDEIEGMLKNNRNIREGKSFSIQTGSRDLDAARNFLDEEAESEEEIEVIDVDADSVDHLKKNTEYIGQGILSCNRCKANRFIDMDLLVASEADETVYNIEDECPHCHDAGSGYTLIGQVGKVQKAEQEAEEETEATEDEAELDNDEKSGEEEATFDNDMEEEPETEESEDQKAAEETSEEQPEEEPEIDTLEEEPEDDGMETDTSEDELDDLDLPKLGDEVDQDETEEDEDNVKESLNEGVQLNALAEEAWMMNRVIEAMNNEEAYYGSWLYIWPDGETREECAYDFGDQESFDELKEEFESTYRYYHNDGLFDADPDVLEYAHKTDARLGLAKIENLVREQTKLREAYDCSVAGDVLKAIMSPENIDKIIILDISNGTEEEPRTVYKGKREDLPMNIIGSPCKGFDVADGHLSCNIDTEIKNTNRPLSKALECFNDEKTDKISLWDQATGDEVFAGTKADACNKFGNCEFISFETPAVVRISISNPGILSCDEIEGEEQETDLDILIKKIIDANNLSQYKTDKPNTNEYWIKNCLEENDDVELIYESFVKPLENKALTREFKKITGYNNPIEEAYEAGFSAAKIDQIKKNRTARMKAVKESKEKETTEVTLDKVEKEVKKVEEPANTQKVEPNKSAEEPEQKEEKKAEKEGTETTKKESVRSFKSRKELAEAITECKNNSQPYTVKRSLKEGFRYDLITEETALATVEPEIIDAPEQTYQLAYSEEQLEFMNNIHRIASDISKAIETYYNIEANPTLIVADILQDLRLISGELSPEDLPDTLINNVTKEMFKHYNEFYETINNLLSEYTGETVETTSEQKLTQAIKMLNGPAFSTANINRTIGSTQFIEAVRSGAVPYIEPNDIPLLEEAFKKRSCEEGEVCEKCGKSPCECVEQDINESNLYDRMKALAGIKDEIDTADAEEVSEDASIDVDTDAFDKEMNEYFNDAYDETVIYTTTDGHIEDDGTIVLEGMIQLDETLKPVEFTLTPEKRITESVENKKEALTENLKHKFIVTNKLSEEKFEFNFNK